MYLHVLSLDTPPTVKSSFTEVTQYLRHYPSQDSFNIALGWLRREKEPDSKIDERMPCYQSALQLLYSRAQTQAQKNEIIKYSVGYLKLMSEGDPLDEFLMHIEDSITKNPLTHQISDLILRYAATFKMCNHARCVYLFSFLLPYIEDKNSIQNIVTRHIPSVSDPNTQKLLIALTKQLEDRQAIFIHTKALLDQSENMSQVVFCIKLLSVCKQEDESVINFITELLQECHSLSEPIISIINASMCYENREGIVNEAIRLATITHRSDPRFLHFLWKASKNAEQKQGILACAKPHIRVDSLHALEFLEQICREGYDIYALVCHILDSVTDPDYLKSYHLYPLSELIQKLDSNCAPWWPFSLRVNFSASAWVPTWSRQGIFSVPTPSYAITR